MGTLKKVEVEIDEDFLAVMRLMKPGASDSELLAGMVGMSLCKMGIIETDVLNASNMKPPFAGYDKFPSVSKEPTVAVSSVFLSPSGEILDAEGKPISDEVLAGMGGLLDAIKQVCEDVLADGSTGKLPSAVQELKMDGNIIQFNPANKPS